MLMMPAMVTFPVVFVIGGGDGIRRRVDDSEFHGGCDDGDASIDGDDDDRHNGDYGHDYV